jgi:hypothetical protein
VPIAPVVSLGRARCRAAKGGAELPELAFPAVTRVVRTARLGIILSVPVVGASATAFLRHFEPEGIDTWLSATLSAALATVFSHTLTESSLMLAPLSLKPDVPQSAFIIVTFSGRA